MSARFLMALFDSIYVIALAAWIGSALFLSLGLIPLIVKQLGPEPAEKLVRALLPRYCVWGAICGALALSSMVAVPLCYPEYRGVKVGVQALAIIACILITLYVGNSKPSVRIEASGTGLSYPGRFMPLFRHAISLNALVAITGVVLLIAFATRASPKTSGIVELTPEERGRYDVAIGRVIEQIEVKYGFRQPSPPRSGEPIEAEPAIDPETVKEIESFYARKRRKEDARAGHGAGAKPARGTGAASGAPPPSS
ncbi:MAG: DUF4149 domain-containing protein [Isosphaeraceae bacterium]